MYILVVDDHPLFAEALRQVLLRLGNHTIVHIAENADKAFQLIEQHKLYDLILVDVNLPGLDGFGLIRKLSKNFNTTPIIIISADHNIKIAQQVNKQGVMGYIHKSLQAKEIISIVRLVLGGCLFPIRDR
ncbi:response regulator [Thiolinea disciformis]|uniref:response regulator n=1 Tax=Thiolinea disciformis TaxID=125614 RepID=UPI0003771719|nr:response regulator transcription factor [Thiolinea disciformis]